MYHSIDCDTKVTKNRKRKYNDAPQRYYLQQPSVHSRIVHFDFSLLYFCNSFNIDIICAWVVDVSCPLSSERWE